VARPPRLSLNEFERLVAEALRELPASFRSVVESENVVIAIEDEPTDEDYELTGTPEDEDLFGIFRGPMRTEMSWDMLPTLPPQAVVFRGPILRNTSSNREAVKEIKDTLVHELGHYFGLEDDEMPC
jgi:predicted Zn-dependent protease with MMP-like domain